MLVHGYIRSTAARGRHLRHKRVAPPACWNYGCVGVQNSPKFPTTLRQKVNVSIILSTPMIELKPWVPVSYALFIHAYVQPAGSLMTRLYTLAMIVMVDVDQTPKFPTTLRQKVNVSIILSTPMIELKPWVPVRPMIHPCICPTRRLSYDAPIHSRYDRDGGRRSDTPSKAYCC
jgi:hypothetical protein